MRPKIITAHSTKRTEIDTARRYGNGTSKTLLGALKCQERGLLMGTKYRPAFHSRGGRANDVPQPSDFDRRYHPDTLRLTLQKSPTALRVHIDYLDPDRFITSSDIFHGINAVHQEGLFGLASFLAWEVAQICDLCDREGRVKPSVHQGKNCVFHHAVELELFPCFRLYGIKFYIFNTTARGFLAGGESRERNKNGSYENQESFALAAFSISTVVSPNVSIPVNRTHNTSHPKLLS